MKNTQFAPIVIPTLNRYEHFKRCLESLEHCTGAEQTDVFVALDYPPSDFYTEGWRKIDDYLREKELNNGFGNLFVRRRERNYGVSGRNCNISVLLDEVLSKYDRYICTEDDNEFAPNFLEYINWGLESFKEDKTINAICGCKNIETSDIKNNAYKLNTIFNAWGYGTWKDRREKMRGLFSFEQLGNLISQSKFMDVFTPQVLKWSSLLYQYTNRSLHGDMLRSLLPENEKWCIFPKVNKVRNWGWDGTGTHGGTPEAFKRYSTLPIDTDEHFEPVIVEDLFNPVVFERFKELYKTSAKTYIRAAITFLSYKLIGYIPVSNKKSKWLKVKLLKVQ